MKHFRTNQHNDLSINRFVNPFQLLHSNGLYLQTATDKTTGSSPPQGNPAALCAGILPHLGEPEGVAALIITSAVMFNACSKQETSTPASSAEQPEITGADQLVLERIENFKTKMMDFKNNPDLKAGGEMSYDSAIWYIDATLNYEYANASHPYAEIHRDTAFFEMDLIDAQRANYDDVFTAYDESLNRLSTAYYQITGEEKQFMMALVTDAGPLPGLKRNLRIITITGTGTFTNGYPWSDTIGFKYNDDAQKDCSDIHDLFGAPVYYEAQLQVDYNTHPDQDCFYYFYGGIDSAVFNYWDYPLGNLYPENYLDYKIFFADQEVAPFTEDTDCLEYDQHDLGINEMNFYYDHLVQLIDDWLESPLNVNDYKFATSKIESVEDFNIQTGKLKIFHKPTIYFRNRGIACSVTQEPPPID